MNTARIDLRCAAFDSNRFSQSERRTRHGVETRHTVRFIAVTSGLQSGRSDACAAKADHACGCTRLRRSTSSTESTGRDAHAYRPHQTDIHASGCRGAALEKCGRAARRRWRSRYKERRFDTALWGTELARCLGGQQHMRHGWQRADTGAQRAFQRMAGIRLRSGITGDNYLQGAGAGAHQLQSFRLDHGRSDGDTDRQSKPDQHKAGD